MRLYRDYAHEHAENRRLADRITRQSTNAVTHGRGAVYTGHRPYPVAQQLRDMHSTLLHTHHTTQSYAHSSRTSCAISWPPRNVQYTRGDTRQTENAEVKCYGEIQEEEERSLIIA